MDGDTAERLRRIADYDAAVRPNLLTRFLVQVGRTRGFSYVYRYVGPRLDPYLARVTRGQLSRVYGLPGLLLRTTGARSGQTRTSPLLYLRDGDDFVVAGTNFGQLTHPGWTANLLAHPKATVQVGRERVGVCAELVDRETWDRLWPRFVAMYPGYADYLERCGGRQPRMFRLRPA